MRVVLFLTLIIVFAQPGWAEEMDCAEPMTQTDMNICAHQEFETADAVLNENYKAAIQLMKRYDALADNKHHEEKLRESQRAWIEYRDAACESETYHSEGGSIQPLLRSLCMTRLTERRSEDLKDMYKEM